jgi:hypothetical protein
MTSGPLAPTRSRGRVKSRVWTPEEDAALADLMQNSPDTPGNVLVQMFPGRNTGQIVARWQRVLNPELVKGCWTGEEDELVVNWVQDHGPTDWSQLATLLPHRIGKQCRDRWTNHLSPTVARGIWTSQEEELLITLHGKFGNKWSSIAEQIPGRTANDVKNRWNSSLKCRLERRLKGEPEFRKRGRKPRTDRTDSSAYESPELSWPSTTLEICPMLSQVVQRVFGDSRFEAEAPATLKENRKKFNELILETDQ